MVQPAPARGDGSRGPVPVPLAHSIVGQGPALFLVHGVGSSRQVWEPIVHRLAPHFRCIACDLRGHGDSQGADQPIGLDEFVADLEALRATLGIEHAHFVGHSLGGMIVPTYARAYPARVDSLGLLSTVAFRSTDAQAGMSTFLAKLDGGGTAAVIDTLMDRWFTDRFRRERPDIVNARKEQVLTLDPRVYRATYRVYATTDMGPWLDEIDAPALVMTGEFDPGCGPVPNAKMAAALPHAELKILPDLRHSILIEAPEQTSAELLSFLTSARAAR